MFFACRFASIFAAAFLVYTSALEYDIRSGRGEGLSARSTWPADHADISRSKFALGAGLPKYFDPNKLKVIRSEGTELKGAQWLYTAPDPQGQSSAFVYALGGTLPNLFVAKVDALTMKVVQKITLDNALYLGGLLVHSNGNVYAVNGNILYKFIQGDLSRMHKIRIPTTSLNGHVVQTNGMLVTREGLLVVKQWSLVIEDFFLMAAANPFLYPAAGTIISLCIAFGFLRLRIYKDAVKDKTVLAHFLRLLICGSVGVALSIGAFMVMIYTLSGPYDPVAFLASNTIWKNGGGGGEIRFIDPDTFEVVAVGHMPERCSIARMSMITLPDEADKPREYALVLLGDELAYQYRWIPDTKQVEMVHEWTHRYRTLGDGTYQATGASISGDVAYFTDNTFPVLLRGQVYSMFRMPLRTKDNRFPRFHERAAADQYDFQAVHLTDHEPGFMFWSVVVSPVEHDIIVWDTDGKNVQSRRLDDMSMHWELKAWNADCLSVAADRQHVYLSDYSAAPHGGHNWLHAVGSWNHYPNADKFFVVANASTGAVLANVTIARDEGIRLTMIIPGAFNDVYLGTPEGLTRVYLDDSA